MSTSALLAVWAFATFVAAGGWLAAGFTAAGAAGAAGGLGVAGAARRDRLVVLGLASLASAAVAGQLVLLVMLAPRGAWFVADKLVALPLAAVGAVIGWIGVVRLPRRLAAAAMLCAGAAAAGGAVISLVLGYPVQPVAVAVVLAGVAAATALALAALVGRGRRAIVAWSAILAIVVGGGVGWSWLAETAAPAIAAPAGGPSHTHGEAAEPSPAVPVTELVEPSTAAPDRSFTLVAATHRADLGGGHMVDAWGFGLDAAPGASLPGPELRVTQGDLVEVRLENRNIRAGVTLHWHGVDVPNAVDGVAGVTQDAVPAGGSETVRFRAATAGTYWYHTHQVSAEGVRRGLYGMFVVEPKGGIPEQRDLALPVHTVGSDVVIGTASGPQHLDARPGETVRLRVANTDQTPLVVGVSGAPYRVAAVDGRELAGGAEVRDRVVRLGAGGRADLVVTVPEGGVRLDVAASDRSALTLGPAGGWGAAARLPHRAGVLPELELLGYGDPRPTGTAAEVAAHLAGPRIDAALVLDSQPRFVGGVPMMAYTVNGDVFPHIAPIVVDRGDVVRLTIANRGFQPHPMHVHGHHVLVLSRDGRPATGAPLWLDTVEVRPGEVWEVLLVADNPGVWMDHCHILDHAAQGMMMSLAYRGVATPFDHAAHGNHPE